MSAPEAFLGHWTWRIKSRKVQSIRSGKTRLVPEFLLCPILTTEPGHNHSINDQNKKTKT